MKSMNLLVYKAEEGVLEERAMDYGSAWMSAVEILDDDTYLGAENQFNLFTMRKNSDAASDEDRSKLQVIFRSPLPPRQSSHPCNQDALGKDPGKLGEYSVHSYTTPTLPWLYLHFYLHIVAIRKKTVDKERSKLQIVALSCPPRYPPLP